MVKSGVEEENINLILSSKIPDLFALYGIHNIFRFLCSVISTISPSSGGSPGPV